MFAVYRFIVSVYYGIRIKFEIWRLYKGTTRQERKEIKEYYNRMADLRVNWKASQKEKTSE